ncbi:hypothetical protein OAG51_03010, partial [Pirellulaceae bacterium]|nr:hypothetical protein [Pirellulaceae bacterium]
VETILGPGDGSIHRKLNDFFSDLRSLTTEPDDASKRGITIDRLATLTNEINVISSRLSGIRHEVEKQIEADVESVNSGMKELFELNRRIRIAHGQGQQPNNLMDKFHQKVSEMSELIDITASKSSDGGYSFQLSGGRFFLDSDRFEIEKTTDANGNMQFVSTVSNVDIQFTGGRIAGYQKLMDHDLRNVQNGLQSITSDLVFQFDRVHSTGLPLTGSFTHLNGSRGIANTSQPLNEGTDFDQLQAGSLFVSVTNQSTGDRVLEEISFDPASQSVDDFLTAINSIANLHATSSSPSGQVTLFSDTGFEFDFAGRTATTPDMGSFTGTTVPTSTGIYTGSDNDRFTFNVVGTGTVGVTDGLSLRVTDQSGEVVGDFDIGSAYEPGSDVQLGNGITIQLASGTVLDGESFALDAVGNPDETGVLVALGLNSLFEGSKPSSVSINQRILDDPLQFALGLNGNSGDGSNIARFSDLQGQKLAGDGDYTLEEFVERINIDIAQEINQLTIEQTNYELIGNQLAKEIDSISGVDPNEEMVFLLQYQKAFEASVRVISTIDEVLSELFSIGR